MFTLKFFEPRNKEPRNQIDRRVIKTLHHLITQRALLDVSIANEPVLYQSLLLRVDLDRQILLLDDLFPAYNLTLLRHGRELNVSHTSKGRMTSFNVNFQGYEDIRHSPLLKATLPNEINANQRRKSYRVTCQKDTGLRLRMKASDQSSLFATVNNLSARGISAKISGNVTEQVQASEVLENCALQLDTGETINCSMDVRSMRYERQPYRHTIVGAKLLDLSHNQSTSLERYLANLQRARKRAALAAAY